jgi:hypothetical protein
MGRDDRLRQGYPSGADVFFLALTPSKSVMGVKGPVEAYRRRLPVHTRRRWLPRVPNRLARFVDISRAWETTCARTTFPAPPWLYMVDAGVGNRHIST